MNILILNWRDIKNPRAGGAEIVTLEHAKGWIRNGHIVTWFTSSFKGAKKEETVDGIRIVRRGNFISVYFLAPFFYFFGSKKYDLIIDEIHGIPFFTPLYVRKPKIALIHEVADRIWDYMYPFPVNKIGRIAEPLYFRIYKNIQFWVPCESTIKDLEVHGISRTKIRIVICAITNKILEGYSPAKEKSPTFIFVSRVVKMKGIEEVIAAFKEITKIDNSASLWIVGGGDTKYVNSLKKMIEKKSITNNVKFFGKVSETKKLFLMQKAHLLLHASVKEGWGLVTVEAASQGTPSVVYDVAGLRDSVLHNRTGIVLDVNSPENMARSALALLENKTKYANLQKNGLKWAKSLNWDKAVTQSLNLIDYVYKKNTK